MAINKEIKLENGGKIIYHSTNLFNKKGKTRRIYFENSNGGVFQIAYGDNQKKFPVVMKTIVT